MAQDAVVSESPDVQNPQNKLLMSEQALNSPGVVAFSNVGPSWGLVEMD